MGETPPANLIAVLERLGLATCEDLRRMRRRVRRLARDLPQFELVWVDALAQARILTPFQAAEINAGRAESLRIGPYVLCTSFGQPGYAACCRARRVDSGEIVRLAVAEDSGERRAEVALRLKALAAAGAALRCPGLAPVSESGVDGRRIWAASPWVQGRTAAEWLVHSGRFPPEVVLEIARAMLGGLVALEEAGICHGDVSTATTLLAAAGGVVLLEPGLRGILRPEEGYAHADLPPEAYDYLPPERVAEGGPPTIVGDVYACGCAWWHMLCGRPPLSGGDSLGKLRAAQATKVDDLRRFAPEVPQELAAAISACLEHDPSRRPDSMARLAEMLGRATRTGRRALARWLARRGETSGHWAAPRSATRRPGGIPLRATAAAVCVVAGAVILWPMCRDGSWWGREAERAKKAGSSARHLPEREARAGSAAGEEDPRPPGRGYGEKDADGQRHGRKAEDAAVVAARYEAAMPTPATTRRGPPDLVLSSEQPLKIGVFRLETGQRVRGELGKRPLLVVPPTGLVVDVEDVRFEDVDFVRDASAEAEAATGRDAALIDLRCGRAEFHGCSFHAVLPGAQPPVAIRWRHPADARDAELSLPSGRLQLTDCVLRQVGAGVDCQTRGALGVEVANTLQLGGGPLVRLDHCPRPDEPVTITLSQVTLRGAGPVLECRHGTGDDPPGEISIESTRCAFVPARGTALLLLAGPGSPQRILRSVGWTGEGSLVSAGAAVAAWRGSDAGQEVLDDAAVSIAGLVRSKVEFAGAAEDGPAASRIIRWQVPLRSTGPPGVDPQRLPATKTGPGEL